jgi:adenylyltransferase/sulfurtransferase
MLGILDKDNIELSNLNRQFLYAENEIGQKKAEVLTQKLKNQNPTVKFRTFAKILNADNIKNVCKNFDIICDCTDNVDTRLLLDAAAESLQKPLVYGAVNGWEGMATVLHYRKNKALTDIFSAEILNSQSACNETIGIVNPVCSIVAGIQASEVLKIILNKYENVLDGKILVFNMLKQEYRKINLL